MVAAELSKTWPQPMIVENKPGANSTIATGELKRSPADGYTLMLVISSHVTNTLLYPNLTYTLTDFAPVSLIADTPFVLVANPKFEEVSGIGEPARLRESGITLRHALPGVGENLQDHLQLRVIIKVNGVKTLNRIASTWLGRAGIGLEYLMSRSGPMSMAPSQLGAFAKSDPGQDRANVEFHVQPLSLGAFGEPLHGFDAFTASVCNLRPTSRGSVHAQGPAGQKGSEAPVIRPNYLSTEEDLQVAADSIRLVRRIAAAPALQRYQPQEWLPGPAFQTEDELRQAAGKIGTTIFHPVGTCAMGRNADHGAVVDARLRVHGLQGLRIADASIMPRITSGNTNSPTIMIAERAADMIREEAGA
ncbi:hypothetical protein BMR85_001455 [Achromobacter sp. KAs 3-5]|nr:hypothetical protein BMR85_001455 [Achromobacter sp. KAs 3-5]